MFVLVVLHDKIRLRPSCFGWPILDALAEEIDFKYANKVFPGVGLCVCLWDFMSTSDATLFPGDGNSYVDGTQRIV